MSPQQKKAWFSLCIVATACASFALLAFTVNVQTGMAAMSLLALLALQPMMERKWRKSSEVVYDERDRFIARRAKLIGFCASYLAFVLANMVPWFVVHLGQGHEEVSVHLLVMPVLAGWVVAISGTSIAALVFYGREDRDAAE